VLSSDALCVARELEAVAEQLAQHAAERTCSICGGVGSTLIAGNEVLCVCQRRAGMAVTDGDERTEPLTTAELETVRRTLAG